MVNVNNINIPVHINKNNGKKNVTGDNYKSLLDEAFLKISSLEKEISVLKKKGNIQETINKQKDIENLKKLRKELQDLTDDDDSFFDANDVIPEIQIKPEIKPEVKSEMKPEIRIPPIVPEEDKPEICRSTKFWDEATVGKPTRNQTVIMDLDGKKADMYEMTLFDVKGDNNCFYHAVSTGILGSASIWKEISNKKTNLCTVLTDYYTKYKVEEKESAKLDQAFFRWITAQELEKTGTNDAIFKQFYDEEKDDDMPQYDDLSEIEKQSVKERYIQRVKSTCEVVGWGGFLETVILYRALHGLVTPTICRENVVNKNFSISHGSADISYTNIENENVSFLLLFHDSIHFQIFAREGTKTESLFKYSEIFLM